MRLPTLKRWFGALVSLLVLVACGDGGSGLTGISGNPTYPAAVDGSYLASSMVLTEPAGTTDLLGAGASISITLTPLGVTTGSMLVPAAYSESGEEEILPLTGTYTYDAATGIVTFTHGADTFIRDTEWHAKGTQLNGTFDGGTYTLTVTLESGT